MLEGYGLMTYIIYAYLGPGPFIKILEEATQRKAMAIGKPGAALRDVLIAKYNITDPKRILFVGDT